MTEQLQKITGEQCANAPASYDDLSVLMLNCTLTRSPNLSHTEGLLKVAEGIFQANGASTEILRPVDLIRRDAVGRRHGAENTARTR